MGEPDLEPENEVDINEALHLLYEMKKALYKNEKIIRKKVRKFITRDFITVEAIVLTPYGVYTRSISICFKDMAVIDGRNYLLPEFIEQDIGVKRISEERFKRLSEKALLVKNYKDFQELVKLVKYSKHIPPLNGPIIKNKACREEYDRIYLSHYLPPEFYGWKPEYRSLKGR